MTAIGAGESGSVQQRGERVLMNTYARYPLELVAGEGARLRDAAGRWRLDFAAGIAVSSLGHGHPAMREALHAGADGLLHVSNLYWTEPMVALAEMLCEAAQMERVFFCNSGAEAVEAALKLVRRAHPGRRHVACFERSFHGRTAGALSVTGQPKYQEPFRPLLSGVDVLPYGDFDALERVVSDRTAAVIVEPVQGEGGVRLPPPGWLGHVRATCDRHGALLVFDEVQCGVGRTGTPFAWQRDGVRPDVLTAAKALAGGLPIGAVLARGAAATAFRPGDHGSTFGGGPFVSRVALSVLRVVLSRGFLDDVVSKGERLGAGLSRLAARHELVAAARGVGLMWGLVLRAERAGELVEELHARGVLAVPAGPDVLRLVPPLTVTHDEIDEALEALSLSIAALEAREV